MVDSLTTRELGTLVAMVNEALGKAIDDPLAKRRRQEYLSQLLAKVARMRDQTVRLENGREIAFTTGERIYVPPFGDGRPFWAHLALTVPLTDDELRRYGLYDRVGQPEV